MTEVSVPTANAPERALRNKVIRASELPLANITGEGSTTIHAKTRAREVEGPITYANLREMWNDKEADRLIAKKLKIDASAPAKPEQVVSDTERAEFSQSLVDLEQEMAEVSEVLRQRLGEEAEKRFGTEKILKLVGEEKLRRLKELVRTDVEASFVKRVAASERGILNKALRDRYKSVLSSLEESQYTEEVARHQGITEVEVQTLRDQGKTDEDIVKICKRKATPKNRLQQILRDPTLPAGEKRRIMSGLTSPLEGFEGNRYVEPYQANLAKTWESYAPTEAEAKPITTLAEAWSETRRIIGENPLITDEELGPLTQFPDAHLNSVEKAVVFTNLRLAWQMIEGARAGDGYHRMEIGIGVQGESDFDRRIALIETSLPLYADEKNRPFYEEILKETREEGGRVKQMALEQRVQQEQAAIEARRLAAAQHAEELARESGGTDATVTPQPVDGKETVSSRSDLASVIDQVDEIIDSDGGPDALRVAFIRLGDVAPPEIAGPLSDILLARNSLAHAARAGFETDFTPIMIEVASEHLEAWQKAIETLPEGEGRTLLEAQLAQVTGTVTSLQGGLEAHKLSVQESLRPKPKAEPELEPPWKPEIEFNGQFEKEFIRRVTDILAGSENVFTQISPEMRDALHLTDEEFTLQRRALIKVHAQFFFDRQISPLLPRSNDQEAYAKGYLAASGGKTGAQVRQEYRERYQQAEAMVKSLLERPIGGEGAKPNNLTIDMSQSIFSLMESVKTPDNFEQAVRWANNMGDSDPAKPIALRLLTLTGYVRGGFRVGVMQPPNNTWLGSKEKNQYLERLTDKGMRSSTNYALIAQSIPLQNDYFRVGRDDRAPYEHPVLTYLLPHVNATLHAVNAYLHDLKDIDDKEHPGSMWTARDNIGALAIVSPSLLKIAGNIYRGEYIYRTYQPTQMIMDIYEDLGIAKAYAASYQPRGSTSHSNTAYSYLEQLVPDTHVQPEDYVRGNAMITHRGMNDEQRDALEADAMLTNQPIDTIIAHNRRFQGGVRLESEISATGAILVQNRQVFKQLEDRINQFKGISTRGKYETYRRLHGQYAKKTGELNALRAEQGALSIQIAALTVQDKRFAQEDPSFRLWEGDLKKSFQELQALHRRLGEIPRNISDYESDLKIGEAALRRLYGDDPSGEVPSFDVARKAESADDYFLPNGEWVVERNALSRSISDREQTLRNREDDFQRIKGRLAGDRRALAA